VTRNTRYLLVGSLLLNLLLVGLMGGHLVKKLAYEHRSTTPLKQALAALPEARTMELEQQLNDLFHKYKDNWKQVREVRKQSFQLLTADPFDAEAYRREVESIQALRSQNVHQFTSELTAFAATLSQPERVALAEMLRLSRKHYRCKAR
jgi:uncharacterized membrane protein